MNIDYWLSADFADVSLELSPTMDMDSADSLVIVDGIVEPNPGMLSMSGVGVRLKRKRLAAYHCLPDSSFQSIVCKAFFSSA